MTSWQLKYYHELSSDLLYQILKIRQEVFVIEQNCNYLDADGYDKNSQHLMGFKNGALIAYMRIVESGQIYKNVSFGRILVKKEHRGIGLGRELMKQALFNFNNKNLTIVMSAQLYLVNFYNKFNFHVVGTEYLEDDILHIKMIRNE